MGITVGALVDDPDLQERRERIYVIDPRAGVTGYVDKMFLPAYDAKGKTDVHPETDFENRARVFDLCGARVGVLFCWEVHSGILWQAIARAQPEFVVSMIKFGVVGPGRRGRGERRIGRDGLWLR